MQALKRIIPSETITYHWWSVRYVNDRTGETETLGTVNSERGAKAWADRMNDETKLKRHYWAEPDRRMVHV